MPYKLNHIALNVKNPEESVEFYKNLFVMLGLHVEIRIIGENIMILSDQGTSIGLKKSEHSVSIEGIDHFGFTTNNLTELEELAGKLNSNGTSFERKKHRDESESIFLNDLDGYKIQIVYMPQEMYF